MDDGAVPVLLLVWSRHKQNGEETGKKILNRLWGCTAAVVQSYREITNAAHFGHEASQGTIISFGFLLTEKTRTVICVK